MSTSTPGRSCYLTASEMNVLFSAGLSSEDVQLYVALRWFRNSRTGTAYPSRTTLSAVVGVKNRAITARLQRLEAAGLIETTRAAGLHNIYRFPYATSVVDDTGAVDNTSEPDYTGAVDSTGVVQSSAQTGVVDDTLTGLNRSLNKDLPTKPHQGDENDGEADSSFNESLNGPLSAMSTEQSTSGDRDSSVQSSSGDRNTDEDSMSPHGAVSEDSPLEGKGRERNRKRNVTSETSEEFDEFWKLYPRKEDKTAARKAFAKALKSTDLDTILAGLSEATAYWTRQGTEKRYIPYPSRWLNGCRWEDELPPPTQSEHVEVLRDEIPWV